MEKRLVEASRSGDVQTLHELLQEDATFLERFLSWGNGDTPLHLAALFGPQFAREYLTRLMRSSSIGFAAQQLYQLNRDGYTPLHLGSANGHVDMVKFLIEFEKGLEQQQPVRDVKEMCMKKGKDGKTAIHCAVISGKNDVISLLLDYCPEAAFDATDYGESVLHLAVRHNQYDAFALLIQRLQSADLLNRRDLQGNTILHLATAKRDLQIVRRLVNLQGVDLNVENGHGLKALDMARMCAFVNPNDMYIEEVIRSGGGTTSQIPGINPSPDISQGEEDSRHPNSQSRSDRQRISIINAKKQEFKEMRSGILIMASLIATVTFQVALTPPGGFWQDSGPNTNLSINSTSTSSNNNNNNASVHMPGDAVLFDLPNTKGKYYFVVIFWNTNAFLASIATILAMLQPSIPLPFCLRHIGPIARAMTIAFPFLSVFCVWADFVCITCISAPYFCAPYNPITLNETVAMNVILYVWIVPIVCWIGLNVINIIRGSAAWLFPCRRLTR